MPVIAGEAPDVVVVGSLHHDILVTGGRRPARGETVAAREWSWKCGGKGGNQAIEAARHGAATHFLGAVGQDAFGAAMLERLGQAGVDVGGVDRIEGVGSGMSVAIFDPDGDYGAVIVPGANWRIEPARVAASAALRACRIVLLQNEVRPETNLAAATAAAGAFAILNAAPAREVADDLLHRVGLLVVNEIEAEAMAGTGAVADPASAGVAARALLARVPAVMVTLGAAGLVLCDRTGAAVRVPGHAVAVSSTHGAGDALIGALAARLAQGAPLAEAARYANAAAAALVATPEAERAALTAADTARFLAR
jgi:ribokinase